VGELSPAAVRRNIRDAETLPATVQVLRRPGSLVVLPTETLYGFSARAQDAASIARVTALKGRTEAGFVALAADFDQVQRWVAARTPKRILEWLREAWPAPLSAILPVSGPVGWGRDSVDSGWTAAFRVPRHTWLQQVARELGEPILSTSVNRTGEPPLGCAADIAVRFGDDVDLLVEDELLETAAEPRLASTLVDATLWPPRLVRQGAYAPPDPESGHR